ncbi:hypothetical protein A2757_01275 [Candidatus Giovannonibacteria bacterium RIFCSPHIGHO2_01_FULL_48_47]|nr:MAG: hypothetical protein A2757_01275 [Candidatus Giovannonibacteria bacterium RIFCSPHIGHO2_01_FULL_48_47]OGF67742.1 MAG: hypothetical protein A3D61_03620 [Candidatus Giovannonibacteria bacterium RIFCSPHIGHO2_02_FULL_48_15]OGF88057.1 MAG: hypothetical protein A3B26_00870 [Candidatus Giovannonibacteria bacterium RIFCSPLOWO2_01_FULL_48_47]OGF95948.1 MAG: hypothetical protein A2613_03520 [Candidatus Giovannonibacteria bacterium RIFOXYD1_FULL_48_21]HBT81525.1 hypothetical protein [Candidatus Gio
MNMKKILVSALLVGAGAIGWWIYYDASQPGKYDAFAKCLEEKEVLFYGTFWCPHCRNQKAMFGKSDKYLPYIECSTADGKGQLPICNEQNISGYPTWEFADGSRETGELSLAHLAQKTGCPL